MLDCLEVRLKTCSRCGETKPVAEFYADPRKEGRYRSICKACCADRKSAYSTMKKEEISEKGKQYYQANKERINQRVKNWRKDNHQKLVEQQRDRMQAASGLVLQLKTPCVKCGEERPWVIQFHHIDPSCKVFELSVDTVSHKKLEIVKEEAGKCACLCANCHTEFHYLYGKNPADPRSAFEEYIGGEFDETFTEPSRG